MTLRPSETIQHALLSTTSHLVGEFENDCMLVTQAWPGFGDRMAFARHTEGPISRNAFVFVFRTSEIKREAGTIVPDYTYLGEVLCAYMAVLYGKRFDNHGLLQGTGHFHVPSLAEFNQLCRHDLPHNSHRPRPDFSIPLDLTEMVRIESLFLNSQGIGEAFRTTFRTCSRFYLQALQNIERNPEVAYLHLITAGEILSNHYTYPLEELLDDALTKAFSMIANRMEEGARLVKFLAGRLYQVRRRFVKTLENLVDDSFFSRFEGATADWALRRESFSRCMAAAYDLRSRYVHTGIPFGHWVSHGSPMNSEVMVGRPVTNDRKLSDILSRAPTLVGLERVIRYALLRAAEAQGVPIAISPIVPTRTNDFNGSRS